MYLQKTKGVQQSDKVKIRCDECLTDKEMLYISAQRNFRRNGKHICQSCIALRSIKKNPRPQNSKSYWTKERRQLMGETIRNSSAHRDAMKLVDLSGPKNGMYGRKVSPETRKKMSVSRIGKLGPNATAWKGGKLSLTRRVKGILHTRYHWYSSVYKRDGWKCVGCGSKEKIDAHHIEPIVKLIKKLAAEKAFQTDEEKIEWIVSQPEIQDSGLQNGITLCRKCHRLAHSNWGSHLNP